MVPLARIERATSPLPRECSTTELQRRNPHRVRFARDQRAGAGEGNRTLVVSLEGFCSTIELHPRFGFSKVLLPSLPRIPLRFHSVFTWIAECFQRTGITDPKVVEGEGFEPSKAEPADLQSAPVDRLGTPP